MAKTKSKDPLTLDKTDKRKRWQDWANTKWVLNNLDEEQLAAMDSTPFDTGRYMDWVAHLVDSGIELKLGWDDYSKCYVGTMQGSWIGYPNTGYACSARSDDFEDIIKILWFKFEYLCNGDMSQAYSAPEKRRKRG